MKKPQIWIVDADEAVRSTLEQQVADRYGEAYTVRAFSQGKETLAALQEAEGNQERVAVVMACRSLPDMTGFEFHQSVADADPAIKRVLLTDADEAGMQRTDLPARVDAALERIHAAPARWTGQILDDLLDSWHHTRGIEQDDSPSVRLLGHRWSPQTHDLRDFLTRSMLPFQWLDVETNEDAQQLYQHIQQEAGEKIALPVVFFPDGSFASGATEKDVAEKIGLKSKPSQRSFDLAIIGGGPAGLSAAVYAASEGLHTVLVERDAPGGQAALSARIENYLGFPSGLSGAELAQRAVLQAEQFGVELLAPQPVTALWKTGSFCKVRLKSGEELAARAVILATGVDWRHLEVEGMERYIGVGVYYGSTISEAQTCRNQEVYVVGGGNSAGQAAIFLAQHARSVTLLVRNDALEETASRYLIEQIEVTPNIHVRTQVEVSGLHGDDHLEAITLRDVDSRHEERLETNSLFVFIGAVPCTGWLGDAVGLDEEGYILTGADLHQPNSQGQAWTLERPPMLFETSLPGVFAVGDVRHGTVKRVASAVGQGAVAVQLVHRYLAESD